jgi:hypothetical protein
MKTIKKSSFVLQAIFIIGLTSCSSELSVMKRKYQPGYYLDISQKLKVNPKINDNENENQDLTEFATTETATNNVTAENITVGMLSCRVQSVSNNNNSSVNFKSSNGEKRFGFLISEKPQHLLHLSATMKNKILDNPKPEKKKSEPLGIIAFVLSVFGFYAALLVPSLFHTTLISAGFFALGIYLLAAFLAIIGMHKKFKNTEKYKGVGFAIAAFILATMMLLAIGVPFINYLTR